MQRTTQISWKTLQIFVLGFAAVGICSCSPPLSEGENSPGDEEIESVMIQAARLRSRATFDISDAANDSGWNGGELPFQRTRTFPGIEGDLDVAPLWEQFFASSVILGGCFASERPVTAFYNPIIDGAVFVQWVKRNNQWKWHDWGALTCEAFVGNTAPKSDLRPRWVTDPGQQPWALSIQESSAGFYRRFAETYPQNSSEVSQLPNDSAGITSLQAMEGILAHSAMSLAEILTRNERALSSVNEWMRAIESGEQARISASTPSGNMPSPEIFAMAPPSARRQLAMTQALGIISDGTLLIVQPYFMPEVVYLLTLVPQDPHPIRHVAIARVGKSFTPAR